MERSPKSGWKTAHGTVLIVLIAGAAALPALRTWPWMWIAPIVAYMTLVGCMGVLRRSFVQLRVGHLSAATLSATLLIVVATSVVLLAYWNAVHPDVGALLAVLPMELMGSALLAGVVFSVVNATLEEFIFRDVLFDAVRSQWGDGAAVLATAAIFGFGHMHGFPPGVLGACMAGLYGVALGSLRWWTCGLALPIIAHIAADATIFVILMQSREA